MDVEIFGPYCIYQSDTKTTRQSKSVFQYPSEKESKPTSLVPNN